MKVFLLLAIVTLAQGSNILYLSNVPSPSHFIWCNSLLNSLHKNGHNITALSPDVETSRTNMTYLHLDQVYPEIYNGSVDIDFFAYGRAKSWELLLLYGMISKTACEGSVKSKGFQQLLSYPDDFKVSQLLPCLTSS